MNVLIAVRTMDVETGLKGHYDTLSDAGNLQWCVFCWYYYVYLIAQCYVPPTPPPLHPHPQGEGHIVFAADSIGISVTLNVCLISREPLSDTDSYQIYIDIQHISL